MPGITERRIRDTPFAVVDLETTGLYPGGDRVVEVAVVRVEPGSQPVLILDTLVNPRRPVSATEIHGITDADVADAPTFDQLAGNVVEGLATAVLASYNVYFDAKFLQTELAMVGVRKFPPHLCLMYMRPVLELGPRCSLDDACRAHGIEHRHVHQAAVDAIASARLWQYYTIVLEQQGVTTFEELASRRSYKFFTSFSNEPLDRMAGRQLPTSARLKPRSGQRRPATALPLVERHELVGEYWDALTAALSDLAVTLDEVRYLRGKQAALMLTENELRWLHARAFAGILADMCQDKAVTVDEVWALSNVQNALRTLGWAPGDVSTDVAGAAAT